MDLYHLTVRLAHIAATIAALIAGVGSAIGFFDMTGNLAVASLIGIGICSVLAIGWWLLVTAASKARRVVNRTVVLIASVALVAVALGTSGWALATAIGGHSAMTVHNRLQVAGHEDALTAAYTRVTDQRALVDQVLTAQAAYSGYAQAEADGDLSGKAGCGPLCRTYERQAETLSGLAGDMQSQIDEATAIRDTALDHLNSARASDEPAVALNDVASAVAALNAIDLDASGVGIVEYTAGADGVSGVGVDGLTKAIQDADAPLPPAVDVPRFEVITAAEATARYADRVAGAWIAAVSIDAAPLLMVLIVMALALEPLLREQVKPRRSVSDAEIRAREEDVSGSIRQPAE